jgi:hypothetical protein
MNEINECPICYEEIKEINNCITECGHHYCLKCILNTTQKKMYNCPLCRAVMIENPEKIRVVENIITNNISNNIGMVFDDEESSVSVFEDEEIYEVIDYADPNINKYSDISFNYANPEFYNEVCVKTEEVVKKKVIETFTMEDFATYVQYMVMWDNEENISYNKFMIVSDVIDKIKEDAYYEFKREFNERKNMQMEDRNVCVFVEILD